LTIFHRKPTFILHREETDFEFPEIDRVQGASTSEKWIEIDTRRSIDGVAVVFHDERIRAGQRAGSLQYDDLRELGVRRLQDFLLAAPGDLNVVVDVKNSIDDAIVTDDETTAVVVVRAIESAPRRSSVLLTSFDPSIVMRVRQYDPTLAVGLTTWQGVPLRESIPTAHAFGIDVLAVHVDVLQPYGIELGDSASALMAQIEIAHQKGIEVACWGSQNLSRSDVQYLTALGVDAIFVDRKDLVAVL
jgi:glycerophosphoryl diester phosphodiesterase